jgi:hypothetical protein
MAFCDVKQLEIDALEVDCAAGAAAVLRFSQVEGAAIRGCKAPAAADPFLFLEGERTRRIAVEENDLGRAAKAVDFGPGASQQSLSPD